MKIWDFNSGEIIDSVKLKTIPQIAIFNKKGNGYLIFTSDGGILEKRFRSRIITKKFNAENKSNFLDAILSYDKESIITCDKQSIKMKNYKYEKTQ